MPAIAASKISSCSASKIVKFNAITHTPLTNGLLYRIQSGQSKMRSPPQLGDTQSGTDRPAALPPERERKRTLHTAHTAHPLGGCAVRAGSWSVHKPHKLHNVRCVQCVQMQVITFADSSPLHQPPEVAKCLDCGRFQGRRVDDKPTLMSQGIATAHTRRKRSLESAY